MKTTYTHHLAAAFVAIGILGSYVRAADINQVASASGGQSWSTASVWENAAAASAGNHYFTNGYVLRTPDTALGSVVFPGESLTIEGGVGSARGGLLLKAGTTTIADLLIGAGTISNGVAGGSGNLPATLNVTNFTVLSTATSADAAILQGAFTNNDLTVGIANLLGDGYLRFTNPRNFSLSVADALSFTGTLNLNQGALTLSSALGMNDAAFTMASSGASLVLSNDMRVSSFSFGASEADTGIYTSAELNTFFSTTAFSGDGLVYVSVIPEPSSCALGAGVVVLALVGLRRRRVR